jgi:metallophosphoesterase (TIGR00282 family)
MKIIMVGDIVGAPGRRAFAQVITRFKRDGKADFVVANAENAAAGKGLTGQLADELFGAGADVLTLGDHAWDQREFASCIERSERIVRPANFAPGCPGRGCVTVTGPDQVQVSVINLVGRVFMNPYDCPFRAADEILKKTATLGRVILVDMHAEATSEKVVMGRYLDGRVTAVVGTHTHVQTSDEALLPKGTAYITDLGMTGPKDSALGRELDAVTAMMLTGMRKKFEVAARNVCLEGVLIDVDPATGKARSIKRLRETVE